MQKPDPPASVWDISKCLTQNYNSTFCPFLLSSPLIVFYFLPKNSISHLRLFSRGMEAITVGAKRIPGKQTLKLDFGTCLTTIQVSIRTSSFMIGGKQPLVKCRHGAITKTFK